MKRTMNVPKKSAIMPTRRVHIATEYSALLPLLSLSPLIWFLMIPKRTKSVAITTTVSAHVRAAKRAAKSAPQTPDPTERRNEMKARPVTIGCRIITRVSALVVSTEARLKSVLSILSITTAGL